MAARWFGRDGAAGKALMRRRLWHWLWLLSMAAAVSLCLLTVRLWPRPALESQVPLSRMVLAQDGELLRLTLAEDGQYRVWVGLDDVAPAMVEALLLKEDRAFHYHPGVNPVALTRAAFATYLGGGMRQGGSTLTMQLARRLYGLDTRRISGKLRQIALALWLEARYGKRDILEAYLNLAPMGGNIEGVETASRIYFGKTAAQLSLSEALALAVIPQKPNVRGRFGRDLQQARLALLSQWREARPDDARGAIALELPVQAAPRREIAFRAPHASEQLLAAYDGQVLETTLSLPLQTVLERQIRRFVRERYGGGVRNAAAILVDTRTDEVKALVGSADYFSRAISGQVNGVRAQRSPGSTLKPFLYGLALDAGLIHPLSIVRDAPTAFGAFQPENHDGSFAGPITAQQALVRSRNVPAVWLAQQLRNPSLHGLLRRAGVRNLRDEAHYGLALALGGGEISPEELARLYLMLAGEGRLKALRYLKREERQTGEALLSPQAAFMVRDMLRHNPRPDGLPPDARGRNWRVAWKTGTSWGYHDAWSAGIAGPYVLVVRVGNFDGRGNPAFVGQKAAAPLFFRIADALRAARPQDADPADPPPSGLRAVQVCRASGELPNRWCPETRSAWFIPGVSPIRVSTLHRPVMVDADTGKALCPPYDLARAREEIHEFWPSDLQELFRQAGLPRRAPPELPRACAGSLDGARGAPPRILSPLSEGSYSLRISQPQAGLELVAAAEGDARRLFWFAGATLIGESAAQTPLHWRPERAGDVELRVSDDRGRTAVRRVRVEFVP